MLSPLLGFGLLTHFKHCMVNAQLPDLCDNHSKHEREEMCQCLNQSHVYKPQWDTRRIQTSNKL